MKTNGGKNTAEAHTKEQNSTVVLCSADTHGWRLRARAADLSGRRTIVRIRKIKSVNLGVENSKKGTETNQEGIGVRLEACVWREGLLL